MSFDPITAITDLVGKAFDHFLPPSMSESDKEKIKLQAQSFAITQAFQEDSSFRSWILDYEGSAKDLAALGWVGKFIMFWRSSIRPGVTIGTFYADMWYWMHPAEHFPAELYYISLMVLVFWFGEKVIKNIGFMDFIKGKAGKKQNNH